MVSEMRMESSDLSFWELELSATDLLPPTPQPPAALGAHGPPYFGPAQAGWSFPIETLPEKEWERESTKWAPELGFLLPGVESLSTSDIPLLWA